MPELYEMWRSGQISNTADVRRPIGGIGLITVDPAVHYKVIRRVVMLNVLEHATERAMPGVRLAQAAYHKRSLCLSTDLGFSHPVNCCWSCKGRPEGRLQLMACSSSDLCG
jgi:hypothetical protein